MKKLKDKKLSEDEYDEEYDVRQPVGREPVEDVRGHSISSDYPGHRYDHRYRKGVEEYDEQAVHHCLEPALCRRG